MAWTDVPTKQVGGTVTHTDWNTYVRDNLGALKVPAMCRVYKSSSQSISNTTWTAITFNAERYDTAAMHSTVTNTDRITIPSGWSGVYELVFQCDFATSGSGADRIGAINVNGASDLVRCRYPPQATFAHRIHVATSAYLTAGDYVTARVYQSSGGALTINATASSGPEFMAAWCGNPAL